jgi:hypothetical protein
MTTWFNLPYPFVLQAKAKPSASDGMGIDEL